MNYSDKIQYQVDYVNSLLKEYNEAPLFDNNNFIVDYMSWTEYLKVIFNKEDSIGFSIIFSSNEFQINIDRTNESLDLSSENFSISKSVVKELLDCLFKSRIKVEYCGPNYTKIYFYNEVGDCVKTLKYVTGLYIKFGCNVKEYKPISRR